MDDVRENGAAVAPDEIEQLLTEMQDSEQAEAEALETEREGPTGAELIAPIVELVSAVAVPNWKLKGAEKQALAEAYGALIDKYFPDGPGQWGVEINALLITGAILTPRLAAGVPPREPKQEREVVEHGEAKPAGGADGED